MARHGENIRKRKDGRWEGRYPVFNSNENKVIYHSVYGKSYAEVKEKMILNRNLSANNIKQPICHNQNQYQTFPLENLPTFNLAAEFWLNEIKQNKKLSTYVKYHNIYESYLREAFGDIPITALSNTYVQTKLPETLSESTMKSIYCVMNQILKFTSNQYSIILPGMKRDSLSTQIKPVEVFTKTEQKKLFSVLYQNTDIFKLATLLCLFTGLRLGELCALKWSDIDIENKVLAVNTTVQRLHLDNAPTKTALIETVPKSACSKREIPIPITVLELLNMSETDAVYVFGKGKALEPRTMQYHFKKILSEAGIQNKNFHILRHTFATNCIENGVDVKSLSEILGHSDVQITLNRYVHPSMDTKRRYMDSLFDFYGQINGLTIR